MMGNLTLPHCARGLQDHVHVILIKLELKQSSYGQFSEFTTHGVSGLTVPDKLPQLKGKSAATLTY